MNYLDIQNIAFQVVGYPISYLELLGTLFGLISVYLAANTNMFTWLTGILNELFLFILFFQVQLYADMFLQVFFFVVTVYGWYNWKQIPREKFITITPFRFKVLIVFSILVGSIIIGFFISNVHQFLPRYFKTVASYPYMDSFIMVTSIIAIILLALGKIETWCLWIIVDITCVFIFFKKGIVFLAVEYIIFGGLAVKGFLNWKKSLNYE